jgi:hypothetical protein
MLFLLTVVACRQHKNNDTYSEWSFQCRQTGEYLLEEHGRLYFGKQPEADSYLWITESTDSENVRIRNKKSGNYIQIYQNGQVVCLPAERVDANNLLWSYQAFLHNFRKNCGWYTIVGSGSSKYLMQAGNELKLDSIDRNRDFRAHWTIVREKGSKSPFKITADSVTEASFLGCRTAKALDYKTVQSDYHGKGNQWTLHENISGFPEFTADDNNLIVALYNMALEETLLDIRTDSTFMAGKLWPDTWTRDVVYSIYFAYSWILPEISKKTLLKQTLDNPKEALQDTGSGGSWPISTDRVVWALAAWEYYIATGDKEWLATVYEGLSYTAEKDIHVVFDSQTGLFKGETCSMDWRTHTYPNWFSNENIGESFSCGTNAIHFFLYDFLFRSGQLLEKEPAETALWDKYRSAIRKNINDRFWDNERGVYTLYLYPQWLGYRSTQRIGIMSNGLCALLGVASSEQMQSVVNNYPLYPYGAAVLYPTIPDEYAYHNKSIWAVWQTPYMYAAKKAGNINAVEYIMKSQIRQGAMFLTHKENMTYDTGYDRNTALNSDRQLWSVASYISIVYRILFGMEMTESGLRFSPIVPADLINGKLYLKNFRYRNAVVNLTVSGTGNKIQSLIINGKNQLPQYELPADSEGIFDIEIQMTPNEFPSGLMHIVQAGPDKCWSPVEPVLKYEQGNLVWEEIDGLKYKICNALLDEEAHSPYNLNGKPNGFYAVYAIDKKGFYSDLSNPILHSSSINTFKPIHDNNYYKDMSDNPNPVSFKFDITSAGNYAIALIGSNGRGPHDVYCYIRSAFVDGKDVGTFILESSGDWNTKTTSNYIIINDVPAGTHILQLQWNPERKGYDNNMSHGRKEENDAHLYELRVIKLQ